MSHLNPVCNEFISRIIDGPTWLLMVVLIFLCYISLAEWYELDWIGLDWMLQLASRQPILATISWNQARATCLAKWYVTVAMRCQLWSIWPSLPLPQWPLLALPAHHLAEVLQCTIAGGFHSR